METRENGSTEEPPAWCAGSRGDTLLSAVLAETGRGRVLLGGSFLEKMLRECLLAKFRKEGANKELRKKLIGSGQGGGDHNVLGTFSAKIAACRSFGLIGESEYTALEAIREIRNRFAHSDFPITLGDSVVSQAMNGLRQYIEVMDANASFSDQEGKPVNFWRGALAFHGVYPREYPSDDDVFLGAAVWLFTSLAVARHWAEGGEGPATAAF